jgi:hypothetical protein
MNYTGELYGKHGRRYFPTGKTGADWDEMERQRDAALAREAAIRINALLGTFKEATPEQVEEWLKEYAHERFINIKKP